MSLNGTFVEDKMRGFKGESGHFSFKKCPIYTHDGASAIFSTFSHETDDSADFFLSLHHDTKFFSQAELHLPIETSFSDFISLCIHCLNI